MASSDVCPGYWHASYKRMIGRGLNRNTAGGSC